jgi:hypothetical protein
VYRLAADTRDEDDQSTGLGIGRLPITLTLQQPKQRKKMEHLANFKWHTLLAPFKRADEM